MNKTTEALKLAEEALEELHYSSGTVKAVTLYKSAIAAIREALADHVEQNLTMVADHSGDANEMVVADLKDVGSRFDYAGGFIYWKKNGRPAGSKNSRGYMTIRVDGKTYQVHRIVWALHNESVPEFIDHINGNKADNRIENLRAATLSENNRNAQLKVTNTSGVKGVHFDKQSGKWKVQLYVDGKQKSFGFYADLKEAEAVAIAKRNEHYKEFARHV